MTFQYTLFLDIRNVAIRLLSSVSGCEQRYCVHWVIVTNALRIGRLEGSCAPLLLHHMPENCASLSASH